jgi:peptidyl-prolyl cis-trans isomerase C
MKGAQLTKAEFDLYLPTDYQDVLTSEELQDYLDRWIETQLLYDEVTRRGMNVSPEVEARIEQYRKDVVADQLIQQVIQERATVSEEEARAYYDAHAHEYLTDYRVSHILVNTLEDAEAVKAKIGKNSFVYLARRYSIDKHSGAGGDLGYLSKGNMIYEFEKVVFAMKKGDVSDIIESEFGFHILTITDVRDARVKLSFEDVQTEIANDLMLAKRKDVYDSLIASLRDEADVEITEAALGLGIPSELDTTATRQ